MMKVLMVCLGNICRSPLADGVLRHKVNLLKLNIEVDSAGTADYHTGHAPDRRMIETARLNGIDISFLRARQFKQKDFQLFDYIYVMDQNNLRNVLKLAENEKDKQKVKLLMQVVQNSTSLEVPDPYYGNQDDFDEVYTLVDLATDAIIDTFIENEER
jgi:protein-tyrosine phosphatase